MYHRVDDRRGVAQCLEAFAAVAGAHASYGGAARLLGAAGLLRQALAATVSGDERHRLDLLDAVVAQAIGPDAAERGRREGRSMPLARAIDLAMSYVAPAIAPAEPAAVRGAELTPREREVAAMIAAGSTNRQIGRTLGITEKTAEVHVRNIMGKLRVDNRASVASWAVAIGLHRPTP